jgi:hypothetical protein
MTAPNRINRSLRFFRIWVRLDMIAGIVLALGLLVYLTFRSS